MKHVKPEPSGSPKPKTSGRPFCKWLIILCATLTGSGIALAQTVNNSSFEADTFTTFPGYSSQAGNGPITGWTANDNTRVGLNPSAGNPFANNGTKPDGTNVAFIQGQNNALFQDLNLTLGDTYYVSYYHNTRAGSSGGPSNLLVSLGGSVLETTGLLPAVGGTNQYRYSVQQHTAAAAIEQLRFQNLAPNDTTVLIDQIAIAAKTTGALTVLPWTNDADSGVSSAWNHTVAVNLGTTTNDAIINGVTFVATNTPDNVSPTGTNFSTIGLTRTIPNDPNNISNSGGPGSAVLARTFKYNGNPETVTFSNLIPGRQYVADFYSVGWENGIRNQTVSDGAGGTTTVNQDLFGNNNGLRLSYTYTATGATESFSFAPQPGSGTWHNYGFSNRQNFLSWDSEGGGDTNWATALNWDAVDNATIPSAPVDAYIEDGGTARVTGGTASAASLQLGGALSGTLDFNAGTLNVPTINMANNGELRGSNTTAQTIGSTITGTGLLRKTGSGVLNLTATDSTYTGETIFEGGILNVASLSNYGVASSIGARGLADENTSVTGIGLHFRGGTLQYTGSTPQSTNRQIRMLTGNGATIDASGSNPGATLSFTHTGANINLFDTPGTRTLTLTGSNTGDNLFAINLTNQGGSATSLTKTGAGKWALSGNSSYTGLTTVDGGTLAISGAGTLGAATGNLRINNGATLDLGGTTQTKNEVGASGGGNGMVGNIQNGTLGVRGNMYVRSGTISANLTAPDGNNRLWIGGDSGATVVLSGDNQMHYSDTHTTIIGHPVTGAAGIVRLGSPNALGPIGDQTQLFTGTLDLNGQDNVRQSSINLLGTGVSLVNDNAADPASFSGAVGVILNAAANIGGNGTLTLGSAVAGGGSFTKIGSGTTILSGANSYGGRTNIDEGVLRITNSAALGVGGVLPNPLTWVQSGAALELQGNLTLNEHLKIRGDGLGNTGAIRSLSGNSTITAHMSINADATIGVDADQLAINATVYQEGGTFGLTKTGAGRLTLSGANTYAGGTTINDGTLRANRDQQNSTGLNDPGALGAANSSNIVTVNNNGILEGGTNRNNWFAWTNNFDPANMPSLVVNDGGLVRSNSNLGRVTSLGNLALNGGTLESNGGYAGWGTYILQGDVTVGGSSPSLIGTTGGTNNYIRLTGTTGNRTITVADATGDPGTDLVINTVLTNRQGGTSGLIKAGPGTMDLSGTNTYTGTTTVNAGTLLVNGAYTGGGTYTIASGASLGGNGSITANIINNGILSPGNSPGILSTTGDFTYGAGSSYEWELFDASLPAGTGWDQHAVTGDITIANVNQFTIDVVGLSASLPDPGVAGFPQFLDISVEGIQTTFDIATHTGDLVFGGGPLSDVMINHGVLASVGTFELSDTGTGGILQLTFTSTVPEPGTWALFAMLLVSAGLFARRRAGSAQQS